MRLFVFALMFAVMTAAAAETNYVNDTLTITLRTGKGTTHKILRMLPAGTPLTIIQREEEYALARTADGLEGWVQTQYLTAQPIARDRLVRAEQKLARLEADNKQLTTELTALREEKSAVEGQRAQAAGTAEKLQSELERLKSVAARPLELEQQNREMRERILQLEQSSQNLEAENINLRDRSHRDWFLAGAGVLIGGMLLGLLLPRLRKRKGWGEWG